MSRFSHSQQLAGLRNGVLLLLAVHVVGTLGYHAIGAPEASWIDSFYMTFITVATIGYGEVVDLNGHPGGRLFTVAVAVVGISTMSYLFSTLVALLVESNLNSNRRRKRMLATIAKLKDHYIICGAGRVGSNVARELLHTRRTPVIIERERDVLDGWLQQHPNAPHLHADAADDQSLRDAGVMQAAGVFAVTGDDSHNLMIALSVKLLNPKVRVVVRLHDQRNADKARRAGADEVVSPDFTGSLRIASAMLRPHAVNFMDQMLRSDEGLRVEEVLVPADAPARRVSELAPRSQAYILVATHLNGQWTFNPPDDQLLPPGTALVLMTNPDGRAQVEAMLRA